VRLFWFLLTIVGGMLLPNTVSAGEKPVVIAHRGASGYLPEHTLAAYSLAIEQGADYIEPDLVMTKDGVFVARHDIYLSGTTDVANRPEYAGKNRTIEGKSDWYVFDFTLAELKTLKARQPRPTRGTDHDDRYDIPTLSEIAALVAVNAAEGNKVGLYPEMKRPDIFLKQHPGMFDQLLGALNEIAASNFDIFFQCFDADFAVKFAKASDIPTILLLGGVKDEASNWYVPDIRVEDYAGKVEGYGINKALLLKADGSPSDFVSLAHRQSQMVHVWTHRSDELPKGFTNTEEELTLLFSAGIDGLFSDFPDDALKIRDRLK